MSENYLTKGIPDIVIPCGRILGCTTLGVYDPYLMYPQFLKNTIYSPDMRVFSGKYIRNLLSNLEFGRILDYPLLSPGRLTHLQYHKPSRIKHQKQSLLFQLISIVIIDNGISVFNV